jgi:hypothetical protein
MLSTFFGDAPLETDFRVLKALSENLVARDPARRLWPQARRQSTSIGASRKRDPTPSSPISRRA